MPCKESLHTGGTDTEKVSVWSRGCEANHRVALGNVHDTEHWVNRTYASDINVDFSLLTRKKRMTWSCENRIAVHRVSSAPEE